ncbi:MAG: GNAT family N-acetyltransferase [Candidatus Gracilibacteria bacterium]
MPKLEQPDLIKTADLSLRKLRLSDAKSIHAKFYQPEILKWMFFQPRKNFSPEDQKEWIKKILAKSKEHRVYVFGITLPSSNEIIGIISLEKFNWANKNAQIGYWLTKEHWGKGIIPKAVKTILNFAFKKLRLHRVYGAVFSENLKSQKVLEKCGFTKEGTTRHATYRFRRWHDKIRYGILDFEFKK